jgi:dGTPase
MVVDRADEIAYMSHDIDDGVHLGLIRFETLKESELIREVLEKVHAEGITEEDDEMFRYRFSSHFINHLVYSLLDYSEKKISTERVLSATLSASEPIPVGFDPALETKIKKLKKLLFRELYQHKVITRKMYGGKQAIKGLFAALMEEPKMLPRYYLQQLDVRSKHRVVADYMASMSDRFAIQLYNEIYGRH